MQIYRNGHTHTDAHACSHTDTHTHTDIYKQQPTEILQCKDFTSNNNQKMSTPVKKTPFSTKGTVHHAKILQLPYSQLTVWF